MKSKRILVLLHELSQTGAPRLTLDALDGIREGRSFRIVSWAGGPLESAARKVGPTVVLRGTGVVRGLPRALATEHVVEALAGAGARVRARRHAGTLRRWKPDLVYVSSVNALPLIPMLHLGDVPVVLHVHELGSALAWFERGHPGQIRSIPDRYVAVSSAVERYLVDELAVPADTVTVVRPAAPALETVAPVGTARAAGPLVVGGAGNPNWTKGVELWLLAARDAVDRTGPDRLRFRWVGWRDNQAGLQFKTMISKLGLGGVVDLVPETDRPFEEFAKFGIFAMASWEESASLVTLEAMSLAIPVVCFAPTGGTAELVGDAGIVVPSISPSRMADAIVDLAGSDERRRTLGEAGAARVRAHFSRERSFSELTAVFEAALGTDAGTAVPHP